MQKGLFFIFIILALLSIIDPCLADSGKWEIVRNSNVKVGIEHIQFFDENRGVAYSSDLLTTNNGGKTWLKRNKISYPCGMFVSPEVGIFIDLSSPGRTIYRTENGGETWQSIQAELNDTYLIYDIFFISPEEGWAKVLANPLVEPGHCFIFHTNDGGRTWEKQFDSKNLSGICDIIDIFFLDSNSGWAVGVDGKDQHFIIRTSDGGRKWSYIELGISLGMITFASPDTGWIVGDGGIFGTKDGGLTWEHQFAEPVYGICFVNEKNAWAIQSRTLLITGDGGKTWIKNLLDLPAGHNLIDISFINEREGWLVGYWGLIMHTQDGGKNWEKQLGPGLPDLCSIDFASPKKGIAVGYEVLTTEDGLKWQNEDWIDKTKMQRIEEVQFVDEETGWMAGRPKVYRTGSEYPLWKTEDGGKTWEELEDKPVRNEQNLFFHDKKSLCFVDQKHGWMRGWIGMYLYHTKDGGETWEIIQSVTDVGPESFLYVDFIDENNGWSARYLGDIYRTKDGGYNWQRVGSSPYISSICFVNENLGWGINYPNEVYHTEDGGKTWIFDMDFPDAYWLSDICYDGWDHIYVAGSWGFIARYTDPDLHKVRGGRYVEYAVEQEGKATTEWGRLKTSISGEVTLPKSTELYQNYPNPFNPDTWIPYQLKEDAEVEIRIYTSTGQLIRTLSLGNKPAGYYTGREKAAYWDGRNEAGEKVASGVYFYTIKAGDFTATKKMAIAR